MVRQKREHGSDGVKPVDLFTISLLLQVGYRKKKGTKAAPLRHCISSLRLLGFRQTAV
ncbi:MAG: hypothetical protein LIP06_05575 [Tannerellaceae bacterium]|nr:hypothetical protein [Tannerellaceae bacterium]